MRRRTKLWLASALAVMWCLVGWAYPVLAAQEAGTSSINRFNVVVALDASNSMNYTDPDGLRYEAISQFTNLLAEQGNYLGGVVFSNQVEAQQPPDLVTTQADKDRVMVLLRSVMSTGVTEDIGYTNIGEALSQGVDSILENGSPDLPSVILFLSDGNTEMPTEEELRVSLDQKADAIQRARENGIRIYSVCLNANSRADTTEMAQISEATGGVFQEVASAENLQEVFNTFYALIYGTSAISLADGVFPADGVLRTAFQVPGIGVEEVNIVINGGVTNLSLETPEGAPASVSQVSSPLYTMVKVTDPVPGGWTLVTEGVPGDTIQINMIYNTDLGVKVSVEPASLAVTVGEELQVSAVLTSGTAVAETDSQYEGYSASLVLLDAYGQQLSSEPMVVTQGAFQIGKTLEEGTYFMRVDVSGNCLEKSSSEVGPVIVSVAVAPEDPVPPPNEAPVPVKSSVTKTVLLWPIFGGSLQVDMAGLATDGEDEELVYTIVSSSFLEGTDYVVQDGVIQMEHFSLSKGSFDIKATDSGGLSCLIHVNVVTHNLGLIALVALGFCALVALAVVGITTYALLTKPFRGTVRAQSYCNGTYQGNARTKRRGRIKLSAFGMEPTGLDYYKSYIQATGKNYVYFVANRPVIWNGQKTNKVRIQSGADVAVTVNEDDSRRIYFRFDSRMRGGPRRPAGASSYPGRSPRRPAKR